MANSPIAGLQELLSAMGIDGVGDFNPSAPHQGIGGGSLSTASLDQIHKGVTGENVAVADQSRMPGSDVAASDLRSFQAAHMQQQAAALRN